MSRTTPCPSCGRPNAPHRAACMYCGAALPEPPEAAPSPPARREAPEGLDKAFQRAMLHGDLRGLKEVLGQVEPAPEPGPVPAAHPQPLSPEGRGERRRVEELPVAALEPLPEPEPAPRPEPPAPSIDDLYAELSGAVVSAGAWEDDPVAAVERLRQARETLGALVAALEEREGPPPLVLPPFRQPFALFVAPPGDDLRLGSVSSALDVDLATARQVAVLAHPRAALRGADRGALEDKAERYRRSLRLPARVLDEAALRGAPAARLALALAGEGPWRSALCACWEPDSGELAGLDARDDAPEAPALVVVGEVVVARYRELRGRRKDDARLSSHGDRRVGVVDLHLRDGVLRVVQGITRLDGWSGLVSRSSALAFRGLPEALAARFPGAVITGRCVCRPTRQPEAREDGRIEAAGWPAWEEHSRACRLLYLG